MSYYCAIWWLGLCGLEHSKWIMRDRSREMKEREKRGLFVFPCGVVGNDDPLNSTLPLNSIQNHQYLADKLFLISCW